MTTEEVRIQLQRAQKALEKAGRAFQFLQDVLPNNRENLQHMQTCMINSAKMYCDPNQAEEMARFLRWRARLQALRSEPVNEIGLAATLRSKPDDSDVEWTFSTYPRYLDMHYDKKNA